MSGLALPFQDSTVQFNWESGGNDYSFITNALWKAIKFTTTSVVTIDKFQVYLRDTAEEGGDFEVSIQLDDGSGDPDGSDVTNSNVKVASTDIPTGWGWIDCVPSSPVELAAGTDYWLVFRTSSVADTMHLYYDSAGSSNEVNGQF